MKHRLVMTAAALITAMLLLTGCWRDPEKVKRRYLENGNKYFAQGKYKEASIMYRNAIKKDPKFGEAYAKLGDTEFRRGDARAAVGAFRRAVELLPNTEEPAGKLADIYLAAYSLGKRQDPRLLAEVKSLSEDLLKKDPKSYHGLRLSGFIAVNEKKFKEAIDYFWKADAAKPRQPELRFAIAQVLNQDGEWVEAEKVGRQIVQDSPAYIPAYDFLIVGYLRRNQVREAEEIVEKKVTSNPKVNEFKLQQAGFYRATQRPEKAEKIIGDLLAVQDAEVRRKVGEFMLRTRDYDRAYQIFSSGADQFSDKRTAFRLNMVQVLLGQGKVQQALSLVDAAVKDDPKNPDALSLRASTQLQYGGAEKMQGAINDLQSLLSRDQSNAVVRYNLARAYQNKGELEAARVQYTEAIKLTNGNFLPAQAGLGQVYLAKHDFGKAIATAQDALKLDPKYLPARVIKSNALINSGNLGQARLDLTEYMKDSPDAPDLQFQLAVVDFLENRMKDAESTFRSLRQKYPADQRLTYAVAEVMIRTNRQQEALKFLREELAKTPDNKGLRKAVADTALRLDQGAIAEPIFRQMIQDDPKNFEYYMKLGEILRRGNQIQAALEMLKKGQQLAPAHAGANLQLAMTLDMAGMRRESVPLYENVIRAEPENPIALNNLAFMYAEEGRDLDQALTYAQKAKQRVPSSDDISDTLGWVYYKKALSDNAISIFKDLATRQPKNPTYHYHLGAALLQKGNKPAARQSLQTALGLKPAKDEESKIRELLAKAG
ncbi:MAG: tetratricopeptide repeat protein [Acidobacteria bacterium]|nr:tetratricopeptide repeat protein [Acidobacteriota bacterium]